MPAPSPQSPFRPALRQGHRYDPSAARRPILVFEDVYKSYAESFQGPEHLARVEAEAREVVDAAMAG